MHRINVRLNDDDGSGNRYGWFDLDAAVEIVPEATRWDGNNNISVHTPHRLDHERLIRTAGGRWVLDHWSQLQGREAVVSYITDEQALEWLMVNDSDDIVAKYFGEQEPERGPNRGGRPTIGGPLPVTMIGDDVLARVQQETAQQGTPQAVTVRELLREALDARDAARANQAQPRRGNRGRRVNAPG